MALDPKYKAVVFDMDGTFMNTKVDYVKLTSAVIDELTSIGIPEDIFDVNSGSKINLDRGLDWISSHGRSSELEDVRDKVGKACTKVELENSGMARPFDGALDVLALLKKKGYKTGILTRGGHSYAARVLSLYNILGEFDAVIARDDFPEQDSKPSPMAMRHMADSLGMEPENILYLGDHKFDWMTARDSGAGFYGVLSGGYTKEDWETAGKNIPTLNSVKDLLDMI